MAQIETWFDQDLKKPVKVHHIPGNVFTQDNDGNLIGVRVYDHGEAVSLSGSVSANVIRPDGGTVAVTGSLSENQATVSLPQAAYAYPGMIAIVIKLTSGTTVTTLCAVTAVVYRSSTDTIIDPGTIIPDIQALIEEMEDVRDSIPTEYDDLVNEVGDIKDAFRSESISLAENSSFDILETTNKHSASGNGVVFELQDDGSFYVHGTSESTYFLTLFNSRTELPVGMKAGKTYKLTYSATNVRFYMFYYESGSSDMTVLFNSTGNRTFTIPASAVGLVIRLNVNDVGTVVDETVNPKIYTNATMPEIVDMIEEYYQKIDGTYYGLFKAGYFNIPAVGSTVDHTTRTPSTTGVVSTIIPCKCGDIVNLNIAGAGSSSGGARAWAYLDENYKVLSRSNMGVTVDHQTVIAPEKTAYIAVNTRQIIGYYAIVGMIQNESVWNGKTWYSYGTSMSDINPDGISGNNGTSGKWPLIVDKLSGMTRHNGAIGSGGICPSLSHGGNVKTAILQTPWDVDLVTLECGLNDWGQVPLGELGDMGNDTFIGNFTQCIKYLVENTRAKIVLITMPNRTYTDSNQTERYNPYMLSKYGYTYRDTLDLEIAICELYGVEVIDTAASVPMNFRNKTTITDFIHFTDLGGTIYGNYIWSKLKDMQPCSVVFGENDYV